MTVTADEDDDSFHNFGSIIHTASGGLSTSVRVGVNITDNDSTGIVLGGSATYNSAESAYEMTVDEGTRSGTGNQYTVRLASEPYPSSEDVEVRLWTPAGGRGEDEEGGPSF